MKDIELYKFINENEIKVDWRNDELVIWIPFFMLDDFVKLIGPYSFEEGGIEVKLQQHYIAFDIVPICEIHGIRAEDILATT